MKGRMPAFRLKPFSRALINPQNHSRSRRPRMKPAPFTYHPCRTLDEAVGVLDADPDESKILAGGQSLVPMLNLRLAGPEHLIDLNGIEALDYVRADSGGVSVGALARAAAVERSSAV